MIKDFLNNNIVLKILALVLAILLWALARFYMVH
jgi:YbbR domain-containing protein